MENKTAFEKYSDDWREVFERHLRETHDHKGRNDSVMTVNLGN